MELVVAGQLLSDLTFVDLECDEVLNQVQKSVLVKDTLEKNLEFWLTLGRYGPTFNSSPRHEPFPVCSQAAHSGLRAIRNDQNLVCHEDTRYIFLVGLELIEGTVYRCIFI